MNSLEKVFEAIEAFKEDMEELDVRVNVSVAPMRAGADHQVVLNLRALVREDLEDLEAEG